MPFSPQELFQKHLEQIFKYLNEFDLTYRADANSFLQRSYNPARKLIADNSQYLSKEVKDIHAEFLAIADLAFQLNKDSVEKTINGHEVDSPNKKIGIRAVSDFYKKLDAFRKKLSELDINKIDLFVKSEVNKPAGYSPALVADIERRIRKLQEFTQQSTQAPTRQLPQQPTKAPRNESKPAAVVTPQADPSQQSPKEKIHNENENLQKWQFVYRFDELVTDIKRYKEFANAENKGKELSKGQDTKKTREIYGEKIRLSEPLDSSLKGLVLDEKEKVHFAKRVEEIKNEKWAVLAHHEYTRLKQQGWNVLYGSSDNILPYVRGEMFSGYIAGMENKISNISSLLKHHQWVVDSQPTLLGKDDAVFITKAKEVHKDASEDLERFKEAQKQFNLAKGLEARINQLKDVLSPQPLRKGISSDKHHEKHKKTLLDTLNKLESPEKLFDGTNRVAGLAALQNKVEEIEKSQKTVQAFYVKSQAIYVAANKFQQSYVIGKNILLERLPADIKPAFLDFMKQNIEMKVLKITDPNNFTDPNKTQNFESLSEQLVQLENAAERYREFFSRSSSVYEYVIKNDSEINKKLSATSMQFKSDKQSDLRGAKERLIADYNKANQELKRFILSPQAGAGSAVVSGLSIDNKYTNDHIDQCNRLAVEHKQVMESTVAALALAGSVFVKLENTQAELPVDNKKYAGAVKMCNDVVMQVKKNIISILDKRPISYDGEMEINAIVQDFLKNDLPAFKALSWAAKNADNRIAILSQILENEIGILVAKKTGHKFTEAINSINIQIGDFKLKLAHVNDLKDKKLESTKDVLALKNGIEGLEKDISEKIFKAALNRVEAMLALTKDQLSRYELLDFQKYFDTTKTNGAAPLKSIYADLFKASDSPFIKENLPKFKEQCNKLAERIANDKLLDIQTAPAPRTLQAFNDPRHKFDKSSPTLFTPQATSMADKLKPVVKEKENPTVTDFHRSKK